MGRSRILLLWIGAVAAAGCGAWQEKVPVVNVNAGFTLADVTWFEQEQTMFVFYRVDAEQGLGPESQLEIAWRTDQEEQPWAPLQSFTPVHTHVAVNCGDKSLCGSMSLLVPTRPRDVQLRLRYHRDGQMTLDAPVNFNVVAAGPPQTNRSLLVYGVFDQTNTHVQWRARHQFPAIRNEQAEALGLRRVFEISDAAYGDTGALPWELNPYGYGFAADCPSSGFTPIGWAPRQTSDRAVFETTELPIAASTSPMLCAHALVTDGTGSFTVAAIARKNPEVAPAFPALRSPIEEDTQLGFLLRICDRVISDAHRSMQVQRLQLQGAPEICIDDWADPSFPDQLAAKLRSRIDQVRTEGHDMVLMIGLHHDDTSGALADAVEQGLEKVLPFERDKSSPRVSGAFVFDTFSHSISQAELRRLVLWCPANSVGTDLDQIPAASERSCAIQPDLPDLKLGPFSFGNLPILPTKPQYLKFIDKYSDAQAGKTRTITVRAPVRTPLSDNVPVGDFGVATFFNNEVMTAAATDRFSFCASEDGGAQSVVVRIPGVPDLIPLSSLPEVHEQFPQPAYGLGLVWDFPFLMRLQYEVVVAGAASAYSLTVPFGIATDSEAYYGTPLWEKGEFPLSDVLLRCTRFCDHPTFDSAGVYNVSAPFTPTFRTQCYRPKYPVVGDGGFPRDP